MLYSADFSEADGTNKIDKRKKQMAWFVNELKDAKIWAKKRAKPNTLLLESMLLFIKKTNATNLAKLPASNTWNNQFLQIVADYQKTIEGVLYANTKTDEVSRLYDLLEKQVQKLLLVALSYSQSS
jgi:hypothetical protein